MADRHSPIKSDLLLSSRFENPRTRTLVRSIAVGALLGSIFTLGQADLTAAPPEKKAEQKDNDKSERPDIKLTKRWTNLVVFDGKATGEGPIPEKMPVWNFPKGYSFTCPKIDAHHPGDFNTDGEFIVRGGYLRREFGNTALLHLPPAQDFDLEGIVSLEGAGGWLMLVGWDIESKSGYMIYDTKLRVSGSFWYVVEIVGGQFDANSVRRLATKDASGEGPLRVRVKDKTISLQAAGAYVFRDEAIPNYSEGHVAIGTFSPQYGAQNIGIKSLRMKLN